MTHSSAFILIAGLAAGCAETTSADPPKFAQDRVNPATARPNVKTIPFDGDRAIKYIKDLCEIGTRISASDGMKKQQELLTKHFEKCGATVTRQEFEAKQKSQANKVKMTNLIAKWHPDRTKRILLCSHYDTRPHADEEADRAKWDKPFLSANDGTSGVAFLMELANHLKELPTNHGVDIVLFDGEEYIFQKGQFFGEGDDFFFGSEHFAREYVANRRKVAWDYEAAILFDLFAHKNARLAVEGYSQAVSPTLVKEIWDTAAAVKAKSFKDERGFKRGLEVLDDHLQLQRAGISAIDIIDFDYDHWHKLTDTVDQCSAAQMSEVGLVITTWLQTKK